MGGGPHGGHETWGNMAHFRGLVTHQLSPFEQRTFAGWISHGVPNTIRRIRGQLFYIGTPMVLGYLIYSWANKYHDQLTRKDRAFYEDEYRTYLASPEHETYLKKKAEEEAAAIREKLKK